MVTFLLIYEVTGSDEKSEENGTATRQRSTQGAVAHGDVEAEDTGTILSSTPEMFPYPFGYTFTSPVAT